MKLYNYYIFTFLLLSLCSCNNWLDVKPKTNTDERDLFATEEGFKEALTGAYIRSAQSTLYGRPLTYGFLEILAQSYRPLDASSAEIFQKPEYYDFSNANATTASYTSSIWSNAYYVIGNLNNLLFWLEENRSALRTKNYYEIIKGEALGLRSYIYFDLLRMFGPVYKVDPTQASLPYRTSFDREAKKMEPADKLLNHIISDLGEAEQLLTGKDPLNMLSATSGDGFLGLRFKRMNLLAVNALMARAYLYQGNKPMAMKYAEQVIDSKKFNLVRSNLNNKIMSGEIIFSLHIDKMQANITDVILPTSNYLISGVEYFNEQFNVAEDGMNDWRVRDPDGFIPTGGKYMMQKFVQTGLSLGIAETMPLMRLPEMYFIMSECEPDLTKAATYLNAVRSARGVDMVEFTDENDRMRRLEVEYRKEFYGEGQIWYFYKRNYYRSFLHCPLPLLYEPNYVFSVPDNEQKFVNVN